MKLAGGKVRCAPYQIGNVKIILTDGVFAGRISLTTIEVKCSDNVRGVLSCRTPFYQRRADRFLKENGLSLRRRE